MGKKVNSKRGRKVNNDVGNKVAHISEGKSPKRDNKIAKTRLATKRSNECMNDLEMPKSKTRKSVASNEAATQNLDQNGLNNNAVIANADSQNPEVSS